MKKFPFYKQLDNMDCGPTCLKMIAKYHNLELSIQKLRKLTETTRSGSSLQSLANAGESLGFRTLGVKVNFQKLQNDAPLPCICYWNERHFVVIYKIKKDKVYIADPGYGLITYNKAEFISNWIGKGANELTEDGILLLLEPTNFLHNTDSFDGEESKPKNEISIYWNYLNKYRRYLIQIGIGLFLISLLQLIFPFLTQSVVDIGIQNKDLNFLYLILVCQLFVFIGRTAIEITRGWILLHLSSRINIALVSDFLIKLMRLPISFFDSKMTGDIMQRIGDHQRIEQLLTSQSLNIFFSAINFIVFGIVLGLYSIKIFLIFLTGTFVYFAWINFFLKRRKDLDHKQFNQMSAERSKILELIQGMQEIKLHNAERQKRWSWEIIQVKLFKLQTQFLKLEQLQINGSNIINEAKNIFISFYTAKLVIDGQLTLGMMLSVSYIIGQLNSPISQFLSFIHSFQDARISLERLSEIHNKENEEPSSGQRLNQIPENKTINVNNLSFRYAGSDIEILKNLELTIPANKVTAIVGASGSGKTTLMKLLLRFYEPTNGKITLGNADLNSFTHYVWRENSGTVMQDGFIFNDTIANNIAVGDENIDISKLKQAVHIANISEFIDSLPLGYNTKIGSEGMGISGGQKQRVLIARSVYKNPAYLFFDEATSALDANNERVIMQNLNTFFKGRTAVVIAHRLSTVKNADQIVVLDKGKIIERGTHDELIQLKGSYFNLVKNQLDLEKIEQNNSLN